MDDESAFQAALDANPEDHVTRLVFADWLEERGDPRGEGYRALGVGRKWPSVSEARWETNEWWHSFWHVNYKHPYSMIDEDWSALWLEPLKEGLTHEERMQLMAIRPFGYRTRREAEDAAALAFAKLPAERRAELLDPTTTGART